MLPSRQTVDQLIARDANPAWGTQQGRVRDEIQRYLSDSLYGREPATVLGALILAQMSSGSEGCTLGQIAAAGHFHPHEPNHRRDTPANVLEDLRGQGIVVLTTPPPGSVDALLDPDKLPRYLLAS